MKVLMLVALSAIGYTQTGYKPVIPKTWDEAALADWATPIAELNQRPTHMSPAEYYAMPVDNLRTYPVYCRDESHRATGRCYNGWGQSRL
jgi:hypothetical protein